MSESTDTNKAMLSEEVMLSRLNNGHGKYAAPDYETCHARFPHPNPPPEGEGANESLREFHAKSDEMREFFIQMWRQNPALAAQGGARVRQLLSSVENRQRGISLIELIIFIVIISVALTGILLVMNQVTRNSADPLLHKQAIAAAESLLEEIQLQDFVSQSGVTNAVTLANRASEYHIVNDYHGFTMNGIRDINNNPVGLDAYNASVAITPEALNGIAAGDAVRITVTVTDPQGNAIALDGYRTKY